MKLKHVLMIVAAIVIVIMLSVYYDGCREGEKRFCDTGLSADCAEGIQVCVNNEWSECIPIRASQEYCDGIDNDCDGVIDDNCFVCVPGQVQQCGFTDIGICTFGTRECMGEYWTDCDAILPINEVCWNNLDDDCDGVIDEDCGVCKHGEERRCGDTDKGVCEFGIETCIGGKWSDCEGAVYPDIEICNNSLDDDCDGGIDENCGVCKDGETRRCGKTDVGLCEYGVETCSNGQWGACVGAVFATAEICDGLDNDCDGVIDNGCNVSNCGNGVCEFFERTLTKGAPAESFDLFGTVHSIRCVDVISATDVLLEIDGVQQTFIVGSPTKISGLDVIVDQASYTPAVWDWANAIVGETAVNCHADC